MRIPNHLLILLSYCGLWFTVSSCKTEDIEPVVSISVDSISNSRVSENGGTARITASLNGKSEKEVRLSLRYAGAAQSGIDYTTSSSEIVIPSGSLSGSVLLSGVPDNLVEGDESIVITFDALQNAILPEGDTLTLLISDDDSDTDHDGLNDGEDGCPLDSGTVANNGCPEGFGLIINEVLYDPSNSALEGDANGDGVYDQAQDEFIELFNNTNTAKNLEGYTISDFDTITLVNTIRYTFPAGTSLAPKKALIVFGGGTPTGSFGGASVLISGGLSMDNSGEKIRIKDPNGNEILLFNSNELSGNPNESYTRSPDITGNFVQHGTATPGKLFSPGTKTDGSPF